jgi:hypothetical protein
MIEEKYIIATDNHKDIFKRVKELKTPDRKLLDVKISSIGKHEGIITTLIFGRIEQK